MWYQTELSFLQSMLKKMNLQILILTKDKFPVSPPDLGIRKFLGRETEYHRMFYELPFEASQNTIYKLTDNYLCNYLYLMLPGESPTILMIGPYMLVQLTHQQLLQEAERFSIPPQLFKELENYYGSIPVFNDQSFLFSIVNSFAEVLWGSSKSFSVVDLKEDQILPNPFAPDADPIPLEKTLLSMEDMERRYAYENEAIRAVSLGMSHKAELMLSSFNQLAIKQRVADPIRNIKNYCIIMNTLMRKAAEQGSVHPLYLDRVSSEFARKIEIIGSTSAGYKLMVEMLSTYCRLVNKHSMTTYSLPIRKTLVCIDANLSGDLTLHTLAAMQNISSGYLSALFKKEVGQTLTDYVNRRRMKQATQLLRSTVLQVQTIAQYCGIPDVNYFSKMFKRYYNCTPKDYRQSKDS
jgi:AraC-like DNA-binding protein